MRARWSWSVAEVAATREDHRRARLLDRRDHLGVALRAAGLDDRASRRPRARAAGPSANGKNASEASDRARQVVPGSRGLLDGDPHGVDAARLARADADRRESFAITIAFEATCLATRQANSRSPHARLVRAPSVTTLIALALVDLGVGVLDEQPAEHAPEVALARSRRRGARGRAGSGGSLAPRAPRAPRRRSRARAAPRRTARRAARRAPPVDRAVQRDDAAVGRDRVAGERLLVRLVDRRRHARSRTGSRA